MTKCYDIGETRKKAVETEIGNFVLYAFSDDKERKQFMECLKDFMNEVYEDEDNPLQVDIMKAEEYYKIKMEMRLLDGGYYDRDLQKYIRIHREDWEKDFFDVMWIRDTPSNKTSTGKYPTLETNRAWYFKNAMHPELFNKG